MGCSSFRAPFSQAAALSRWLEALLLVLSQCSLIGGPGESNCNTFPNFMALRAFIKSESFYSLTQKYSKYFSVKSLKFILAQSLFHPKLLPKLQNFYFYPKSSS